MLTEAVAVKLKPVVRFREFPLGTKADPSMRDFLAAQPYKNQAFALSYLRSGLILAHPMGADVSDCFDRTQRANPTVDGKPLGGATPLTDGEWFWYAALIHYVEKYNTCLPPAFLHHAEQQGWRLNREAIPRCRYDFSYF